MPDFKEYAASHAPALILLEQIGYEYVPPTKALAMRGGRKKPLPKSSMPPLRKSKNIATNLPPLENGKRASCSSC
ncbi:hypothetical protein [Pseudodesulfovibrio portus]|uniref:Uncharacterized protein n=1 Tax=Pseudodesulfovibrio portus TaxID=231439 RepID=A0ABM8AS10_9BACT|nr:hypothetical protein [Pseudodesulfovibrio portus]BDQ34170.1 hypothetical protein JCM14722_17120 [Pseudodesulfovibrio portus]